MTFEPWDSASELLEQAPVAFVVLDQMGRVERMNAFLARLLHCSAEESRGVDWIETFIPERERPLLRAMFQDLLEAGAASATLRNVVLTRRGEERVLEWHNRLLRDGDGGHLRTLSIGIDVTDRLRAEAELEGSRRQLAEAQRIASLGSWELDLTTGHPTWSDETYRILEIDPAVTEGLFERFLACVHPEDLPSRLAQFERAVADGTPFDVEARLVMPDGRIKHVHQLARRMRVEQDPTGQAMRMVGTMQDVTSARQAEAVAARERQRLIDSEARLNDAQRLAKIGSWELDLLTNELTWSDEVYRIFEIDPAKFGASYDAFLAAIHPDDRDLVDTTYRDSLVTRQPYEVAHRLRMLDGRIKFVRERGQSFWDADGRAIRSVGTVQDVSAQVHAEQRTQRILDGIPMRVFALDRDGRVLECSHTGVASLGKERADVIGRPLWEFPPWTCQGADGARLRELFARALHGETIRADLAACLDPRVGRMGTLDFTLAPLANEHGQIQGVLATGVDVSERERMARELAGAQARLLKAEAMARLGSWSWDLDTGKIAWSPGVYRIFDLDPATHPAPTLDLILGRFKSGRDGVGRATIERLLATGRLEPTEGEIVLANGEVRWVVAVGELDNSHGKRVLYGFVQDVTQTRLATEAQARALAEKETLLREIHHRVKNNLQIVSSLLHFQGKKAPSTEGRAAFADARTRLHAMTLVHETLYQTTQLTGIELAAYLRALVNTIAQSLRTRPNVRVSVVGDPVEVPLEVALPCGMLTCELVTNVFKYAFPDKRAGEATVSVRMKDGKVVLVVEDDGVGLPAGFDVESTGSFGWVLIRNLTEQLDGTLHLCADRGTCVEITFPPGG